MTQCFVYNSVIYSAHVACHMIEGDIPVSAPPTWIKMQDSSGGGSLRQRLGTLLQSLGGRTGSSSRPEEPWKPDQTAYFTEDILHVKSLSLNTM